MMTGRDLHKEEARPRLFGRIRNCLAKTARCRRIGGLVARKSLSRRPAIFERLGKERQRIYHPQKGNGLDQLGDRARPGLCHHQDVLSCTAKAIKVSILWKNLEKEQIRGIHLVCVLLTSSTAHPMYGSGSSVDRRCSLRTWAKRLVLARLGRNF
jgi:hypothetical protein